MGPAGVTIVIIRKDFLEKAKTEGVPTILRYQTHTGKIFNTPPTFNVYMVNLVLEMDAGERRAFLLQGFLQGKSFTCFMVR
ncbi:MAG: hypothetical protein U5K69_03710 [Balneolaceae bacterium]|nr:hypothetical protein [Balneolaceae bacterium]